jgi:hypothetical protein
MFGSDERSSGGNHDPISLSYYAGRDRGDACPEFLLAFPDCNCRHLERNGVVDFAGPLHRFELIRIFAFCA